MNRRACLTSLLLLLFVILAPSYLPGQATEGSILGNVTDNSGAAVVGAEVTVTNINTNFPRITVTNSNGEYVVTNLPLGNYSVAAKMTGFKQAIQPAVQITVKARVRVNLTLEVGELSQTVEVTAAAPTLRTDSPEISTLITRQQLDALPSQNHHFLSMSVLTPGTYRMWTAGGGDRIGDFSGGESVAVQGMGSGQNNFILDGVQNNVELTGGLNAVPATDAIQEVSFQTSNYSAEFGRSAGAIVNVAMRSGANQMHGFGYDFIQNDKINASPYDFTGTHPLKPPLRRNLFGGGVSGPVIKNKVFYFVNYEGIRQPSTVIEYDTVPTALEKKGDFSQSGWTVYDPATTDAKGNRTAFAGNVIPSNRIDPLMSRLTNIFPTANYKDPNPSVLSNYLARDLNNDKKDALNVKTDFNLRANDTMTLRYSKQWYDKTRSGYIPDGWIGGLGTLNGTNAGFTETHVFSPNLVNEARIGWNYIVDGNNPLNLTMIDELKEVPGGVIQPGFPTVSFRNIQSTKAVRPLTTLPNPYQLWQSSFQYMDNVSWHRGKHAFKMGAEYVHHRNDLGGGIPTGGVKISTDGYATVASIGAKRPANQTGTADGLLGQISQLTTYFQFDKTRGRDRRFAAFFQDDWRVTKKLSLSLGVRYEYFPNWYEKNDRMTNFNTATGKIEVPENTRSYVARTLGLPNGNLPSNYQYLPANQVYGQNTGKDFSPRLGFAYSATDKIVIRGGFGLFYSPFAEIDTNNTAGAPFSSSVSLIGDTVNAIPITRGFPTTGVFDTLASNAIAMAQFQHQYTDSYVEKYGLTVQFNPFKRTVFEAGFVGNHAIHLDSSWRVNFPTPGPGEIQPRRPYPGLGEGFGIMFNGWTRYNALEVTFRQQVTHGLTAYSSLTLDHMYGNTYSPDPYNWNYGYGNLGFDTRRMWSSSLIYEIPYRQEFPSIIRHAVGGWQASGIIQLRGGIPFSVASAQNMNDNLNASRANYITTSGPAALPTGQRSINKWFNTNAFTTPADYTYGNSGLNILQGPGFEEVEFALQKSFRVMEGKHIIFRAEAENAFNHPNYGLPTATVGNTAYGTIRGLAGDPRLMQMMLKLTF